MTKKKVLTGILLGNVCDNLSLRERWGRLGPGIWDDDKCPGCVMHVAVLPDGRVISLGEADLNLEHKATAEDFERYEVIAEAA